MTSYTLDDATYRQVTHVPETPSVPSIKDQWLDWGDHTVTVDPVRNKQWIDDSHDRHFATEERARGLDERSVRALVNWEDRNAREPLPRTTILSHMINRLPLYSAPIGRQCNTWRGANRDASRLGELPTITAMIHEGRFPNKNTGQIEAEIREAERTRAARVFNCEPYSDCR